MARQTRKQTPQGANKHTHTHTHTRTQSWKRQTQQSIRWLHKSRALATNEKVTLLDRYTWTHVHTYSSRRYTWADHKHIQTTCFLKWLWQMASFACGSLYTAARHRHNANTHSDNERWQIPGSSAATFAFLFPAQDKQGSKYKQKETIPNSKKRERSFIILVVCQISINRHFIFFSISLSENRSK